MTVITFSVPNTAANFKARFSKNNTTQYNTAERKTRHDRNIIYF